MRGIVVALVMLAAVPANAGISIAGRSAHMTIRVDRWQLGNVVARGIVVDLSEVRGGMRACARASIEDVTVDGCALVPSTRGELRDVTWRARAPTWSAHGEASLVRPGALRAHAVLNVGANTTIELTTTGPIRDLAASGELRTRGKAVPFTARANLVDSKLTALVAPLLGGELSLEPVVVQWRAPIALAWHVRGVELDRLVPSKLAASGVLDGEVAMRVADGTFALVSASLHTRAPGRIRVTDATWLPAGTGLTRRITGTLADFQYSELAVAIAPRGSAEDMQVTLRGRGTKVPQDLDLTVNFHGVRDVVDRWRTRS